VYVLHDSSPVNDDLLLLLNNHLGLYHFYIILTGLYIFLHCFDAVRWLTAQIQQNVFLTFLNVKNVLNVFYDKKTLDVDVQCNALKLQYKKDGQ